MECEITFRKKFKIREDQDPADIGKTYIESMGFEVIEAVILYDPNYGDDVLCACGHPYCRHFDSYEEMSPVGCKYCHGWEEGVTHRLATPLPANPSPDEDWAKYASICTGFKRASIELSASSR